jgi:hypothetical protein
MAGMAGLSSSALSALKGSLAAQSAPPNPQTPHDRSDPSEALLLDLQRIRRSLEVAKEHLPEGDPRELLIGAMHGAVSRLLSHIELSDAVDVLLERCWPIASSTLKQKVQMMFSPPPGLGGGAVPGQVPGNPGGAGAPTGPNPAPGGEPPALAGPGVPAGPGDQPPGAA